MQRVSKLARACILALIGILLFVDKSGNDIWLFLLSLLQDFKEAGSFLLGIVPRILYRELCHVTLPDNNRIAGALILL